MFVVHRFLCVASQVRGSFSRPTSFLRAQLKDLPLRLQWHLAEDPIWSFRLKREISFRCRERTSSRAWPGQLPVRAPARAATTTYTCPVDCHCLWLSKRLGKSQLRGLISRVQVRSCSSQSLSAADVGRPSSPAATRAAVRLSDLRRLFSYAKPERAALLAAVGLLSVSSLATIAFPFAIGKTIDAIVDSAALTGDDGLGEQRRTTLRQRLNQIVAAVAGLVLLGGFANFGRVYLINVIGQRITNRLRVEAHGAIMRQDMAFFDARPGSGVGSLASRLSSDAARAGSVLTQNVSDGARALLSIGGGMALMLHSSPELTGVALAIVPPVAVLAIVYARRLKNFAAALQSRVAESNDVADEQFSNIRAVRMFTREPFEIARYARTLDAVQAARDAEARRQAVFYGTTGATGNAVVMLVLWYGGALMTDGRMSIGTLSSFLIYSAYVGISLASLTGCLSDTMKALGASHELFTLIDRQPATKSFSTSGMTKIPVIASAGVAGNGLQDGGSLSSGSVEFVHVAFSYPARPDVKIFSDLNLRVPAGRMTAVVGRSGSGKSTLASLLVRLYEPTAGQILLDGEDIASLDPTSVRRRVGVVTQDSMLFSASIRDNILYGRLDDAPGDVNADVVDAARAANACDFIGELPLGFDTAVGGRGALLSAGQRQRIAIARAIVRRPRVLILDEATSSLDSVSERLIQAAVEQLAHGRTLLVIAHRLSTIQRADNIVVLHAGRVVEQGRFEELARMPGGAFRELVDHQLFTAVPNGS